MEGFVVAFVAALSVMFTKLTPEDVPKIRDQIRPQQYSAVRVAVAINGLGVNSPAPNGGPLQADGTAPAILAYDEIGNYIGWSDWNHKPHIKSGDYVDIVVHQKKGPGQQATNLQLFARKNAICIAYITQTWADGQMRGWMGDMGHACGRSWYYSHLFIGEDGHSPDCMWLDADHSNDPENDRPVAVQIHMNVSKISRQSPFFDTACPPLTSSQSYANSTTEYSKDPAHYCSSECIIFHGEVDRSLHLTRKAPKKSQLFTPGNSKDDPCCMNRNKKRQESQQPKRRSPDLANRLIASPRENHSARRLCESKTSHGPDFVSVDEWK
ncbi:MAG: hypothetical protein ASARMPRED_000354 [Alectoria sarmentosa]|nr:MAG: hypothetical protein ASARMPRED_000354 [Alectoria sarmentosa]